MKKIIAMLAALFMALVMMGGTANATGKAPSQNVKCDVVTADYHRDLTNGDHINMTITDASGDYQVNAYVDRNLGGYDTLGIRYKDANGDAGTKALTKNEVERGVITFNYGDFLRAKPYTVKFVQTNGTDTWPDLVCGGTDEPDPSNKRVELCHATSSATNSYVYLSLPLKSFLNQGHSGNQGTHGRDIYEGFTYTTKGGDTVTVPGKNTDKLYLLDANPKCAEPKVDEKIAKPTKKIVDKCEAAKDDFSVPGGRGYTVGNRTGSHPNWSITVTADEGFQFSDGSKSVTYSTTAADFPNNDDCSLPETGGEAQYNSTLGGIAIAAMLITVAGVILLRRRN